MTCLACIVALLALALVCGLLLELAQARRDLATMTVDRNACVSDIRECKADIGALTAERDRLCELLATEIGRRIKAENDLAWAVLLCELSHMDEPAPAKVLDLRDRLATQADA